MVLLLGPAPTATRPPVARARRSRTSDPQSVALGRERGEGGEGARGRIDAQVRVLWQGEAVRGVLFGKPHELLGLDLPAQVDVPACVSEAKLSCQVRSAVRKAIGHCHAHLLRP